MIKALFVFLGVLFCSFPSASAQQKIKVVTTQTIFAEVVKEVGGSRVDATALASPQYNIHFIEPKPSDVRKVRQADLYVNAGLGLEAWSDPLLQAAGRPELFHNGLRHVDVSAGIKLLDIPSSESTRADGDIHSQGNPHYHMSPENIRIVAQTITDYLKRIDPANADGYEKNLKQFQQKLDDRISVWKKQASFLRNQEIFSYHKDIIYLADFLGIKVNHYLEPKPGIAPTARHLQFLKQYALENKVKVIVMPTYYPKNTAESLANQLGAHVLTIAQGVGEVEGTNNIFQFFDFNISQLIKEFSQ